MDTLTSSVSWYLNFRVSQLVAGALGQQDKSEQILPQVASDSEGGLSLSIL